MGLVPPSEILDLPLDVVVHNQLLATYNQLINGLIDISVYHGEIISIAVQQNTGQLSTSYLI